MALFTIKIAKEAIEKSDGVTVFLIVKNEEYILPHFFKHYESMGVGNFIIYDDKSTDRTLEILRARKDCTILTSDNNYGDHCGLNNDGVPNRFGTLIKDIFPKKMVPDGWVLTVDADELLVLPKGFDNINSLTQSLEDIKQFYLAAPMVDFYPATLNERNFDPEINPFKGALYFDRGPLFDWSEEKEKPKQLFKGVRYRLREMLDKAHSSEVSKIYGNKYSGFARTWKVPLLKNGMGINYISNHEINCKPNLDLMGTIAHFKFCPNLDSKIQYALESAAYYNGSIEYKFLDAAIKLLGHIPLLSEESVKYENVDSFVSAGLSSNKFWVDS